MKWSFIIHCKNWSMIIHTKLPLELCQNWIWYDSSGNEFCVNLLWISLLQFLQCLDNHLTIIMWGIQNPVSTLHEMLQIYEKLMYKVVHSSKVATTLLQPRNFHEAIFYTGKIDIRFINTVCMALEEPITNTVYSVCKLFVMVFYVKWTSRTLACFLACLLFEQSISFMGS